MRGEDYGNRSSFPSFAKGGATPGGPRRNSALMARRCGAARRVSVGDCAGAGGQTRGMEGGNWGGRGRGGGGAPVEGEEGGQGGGEVGGGGGQAGGGQGGELGGGEGVAGEGVARGGGVFPEQAGAAGGGDGAAAGGGKLGDRDAALQA